MKKITSILIAILICCTISMSAFAADGSVCTVSYTNASEFIFNPEGGDLFKSFKGVMPGDELTQEIVIYNQLSEKDVSLYLRAEIDEQYKDFLRNIEIKVTLVNPDRTIPKVIAENLAYTPGVLVENTSLGTYAPGEQGKLTVTIKVDERMGNEFANAKGVVNWIFSAEEGEVTTEPPTTDKPVIKPNDPTKPNEPTKPSQPTKPNQPTYPGQPDIPDTGIDFDQYATPIICLVCCSVLAIVLFYVGKKKKKDETVTENKEDILVTPEEANENDWDFN